MTDAIQSCFSIFSTITKQTYEYSFDESLGLEEYLKLALKVNNYSYYSLIRILVLNQNQCK